MKLFSLKNFLLCLIVFSAVFLAAALTNFRHNNQKTFDSGDLQAMHRLPDDVDYVLKGYKYSETGERMEIRISGKRVIRRGQEFLGLRSNLVKTNFFEDIRGTLHTRKGHLAFTASEAEWSALATQPFILKKNVSVTLNGNQMNYIKSARLYLKKGVLEIDDGRIKTFHLE